MTTPTPLTPGIYYDFDEDVYHGDPALSQSAMKTLLELPARFAYEREHPPQPTKAMTFGTVVHELVLHSGNRIVEVDAKDWRTKAAQAARDEAYEAGKAPILAHELEEARRAAQAVLEHPVAGPLLTGEGGASEVTLRWDDPATGVPLRGRIDRLHVTDDGLWHPVDLKTARDASRHGFGVDAWNRRYGLQDVVYTEGLRELSELTGGPGVADEPMTFVVVETTAPYLVNVGVLARGHRDRAQEDMREALDLFVECSASGVWPGYPEEVGEFPTPRWIG